MRYLSRATEALIPGLILLSGLAAMFGASHSHWVEHSMTRDPSSPVICRAPW